MKWRDAVKAAIMHGPLPPDVTLDAPHWWLPGMQLLPPADYVAPVRLKRKRDVSAEPKTETAKRAYRRTPDEAKLWFQDFHAYQARVHGKSLAYNIRRAKQLVPELFGPVAPDTFRRWHDSGAPHHPWTCHHSTCRVSRTSHMPSRPASASASPLGSTSTAVCCASSTSNSSPADDGRGSFCAACSSHGSSRRLTPATGRARLTLQESVNFCSCASSTCAIASESHRIASGTWTRQLCASFQQATANMRGGMWTQIVYEGKSGRVHPHGPHFPRQLMSHSPTHWITQEALLDMIDAIDADMHARPGDAELTPWLLVLDCAPQHIAAEFRSIMRDTKPHIKLCYVQRNFTGYTQPLDRAYMRAFKNSIHQEEAKHFADFFLEIESNFERVNLDSSTAVLRQLLLSFVHTAAQNADSPQHRTAGWCFIDRNEVEQRELLAEAKRLLETGELFP